MLYLILLLIFTLSYDEKVYVFQRERGAVAVREDDMIK